MDSPVHAEMVRFCEENELRVESGLIQNEKAISVSEAKKHRNLILRWRKRACETCQKEFDITEQGLFYSCKRC